jgi:hypothetical protein
MEEDAHAHAGQATVGFDCRERERTFFLSITLSPRTLGQLALIFFKANSSKPEFGKNE